MRVTENTSGELNTASQEAVSYFSAGLSLGSPMSSPAHASSGVQDEVGMQGKERARSKQGPSTSLPGSQHISALLM